MEIFIQATIFIMGCMFGSFFNVCIYRLPLGISIVKPRSFCPNCKMSIKAWQNIPIISYILLMGRCQYCKTKIPFRYPFVELLTGMSYLVLLYNYGISWELLEYIFFVSVLIIITFIDIDHQLILNCLTYPTIVVGLLISIINGMFIYSLIGVIVGFVIIYLLVVISPYLFGKEGMGYGDVKLVAAIGSFLGWQGVLLTIFIASFLGSFVGITLILSKKIKRGEYIAFGPYLCMGAVIALLCGNEIITWYLRLAGNI